MLRSAAYLILGALAVSLSACAGSTGSASLVPQSQVHNAQDAGIGGGPQSRARQAQDVSGGGGPQSQVRVAQDWGGNGGPTN